MTVLCAALFSAYLMLARSTAVSSDGAAIVLQGCDMLRGNLLLHGWHTADVSFWGTEVPEFAMVAAVRGCTPDVVHVASALTYTLLVLLAAVAARRNGSNVRAAIALVIVIAPLAGAGSRVFLIEPNHTGTAVPVLVLVLLADRLPRRWYSLLAIFGVLIWGQVSDQLVMVAGALPLAAVGLLGAAGLLGEAGSPGSRRYSAGLAAVSLASIPAAHLGTRAIAAAGGYAQEPLPNSFTWPAFGALWQNLRLLYGVSPDAGTPQWLVWPHYLGMTLAGLGLAAAIAGVLRRRADWVTAFLLAGIAAVLAAGAFSTIGRQPASAHEIALAVPVTAALAGRVLPVPLRAVRVRPPVRPPVRPSAGRWAAATAVLVCLAALGYEAASAPAIPPPSAALAAWLSAHHLTSGLGDYWDADSVTLSSAGAVRIGSVAYAPRTGIRPFWREAQDGLLDPARSRTDFVVSAGQLPYRALRAQFGRPLRRYRYQQYTIVVWRGDLLTRLPLAAPLRHGVVEG